MALDAPTSDRKRVKVYELRNNDWFDRGTGFCVGQIINVSGDRTLMGPIKMFTWRELGTGNI